MSLRVKCDGAIGLPIYGFLLMFDMIDINVGLSRSIKANSNGADRLTIYNFPLMYNHDNGNHMSISDHLGVIGTQNFVSFLLSSAPLPPPPYL